MGDRPTSDRRVRMTVDEAAKDSLMRERLTEFLHGGKEQRPYRFIVIPEGDTGIRPGSACVAEPVYQGGETFWNVYYEGNIYGQFESWEECLFHAADRMAAQYPTIARMTLPYGDVQIVGLYDHAARKMKVYDEATLDAWRKRGTDA